MILIGIAGKSGSGKTTLSKYLEQKYENIIRVGVDEIVRSHRLTPMRDEIILAIANSTMSEEELKIRRGDYENKLDIYVNKKVDEVKEKSPEIIIVDYALLYSLKEIWNKLNYKIIVRRNSQTIKKGLIKRSGKEKAEMLELVNERICEHDNTIEADYKISNVGNIENFYREIDKIIEDIFERENIENS